MVEPFYINFVLHHANRSLFKNLLIRMESLQDFVKLLIIFPNQN